MTHRGRGCLEINPSENPFFQPTNAEMGKKPGEVVQWKVQGKVPPFHPSTHSVDGNFPFLYTRESDRIGAKVSKPVVKETRLLTKTEFLKKKREEFAASVALSEEQSVNHDSPMKRTAEDILAVFKHTPKAEDPRFSTSSNEYGRKAPSVATIVTDRAARPQGFSKSFNNVKPQNTSLTTSITRSNVHSSLDPQFA